MYEIKLDDSCEPIVVSNTRGSFVQGKRSREGIARYAFSEVPLDEEGAFLISLYESLHTISAKSEWENRCKSVSEAVQRQHSFGLEPRFVVVSASLAGEVKEEDALRERLDLVDEESGPRVLIGELPDGAAMVTSLPSLVGAYTRVGDHVGVIVYRADQSIVLVSDGVA